jgi:hypothetical protein
MYRHPDSRSFAGWLDGIEIERSSVLSDAVALLLESNVLPTLGAQCTVAMACRQGAEGESLDVHWLFAGIDPSEYRSSLGSPTDGTPPARLPEQPLEVPNPRRKVPAPHRRPRGYSRQQVQPVDRFSP